MKKIWLKIKWFWAMKVKNRVQLTKEMGGFVVKFRQYDMEVSTKSKNFMMKVRADMHPFGYLASSVKQGKEGNLHGYAMMMYMLATGITEDERLNKEVISAIRRYNKRVEAMAAATATDESSEADLNVVKADEMVKNLSRKERRERKREMAKIVAHEKERQAKDE